MYEIIKTINTEVVFTNCEIKLEDAFKELGVKDQIKSKALSLLQPLKEKNEIHRKHYEHCVRVGLLAKDMAAFLNLDKKALFYAGLLHDIGKQDIPAEILGKKDGWTNNDALKIQEHVMEGYKLLQGKFDFSAEIILWHHKFQENGYPQEIPPLLHNYSDISDIKIAEYGRILAIADVYDALHRDDNKFSTNRCLSDTEIEDKMLNTNYDKKQLIVDLYNANIFVNSDKGK